MISFVRLRVLCGSRDFRPINQSHSHLVTKPSTLFPMRRKNRKWVALAVGVYLFILYSAARWSIHQRLPGEPNILVKHDREVLARMEAEKAKHTQPPPQPTGEMRLTAAGPAYIAA